MTFTPEERVRLAAVAFTTAKNAVPEGDEDETTEEDIAAIGRSLAEEAAGQILDGDAVMAEMREMLRKRREVQPK